MDAKEQADVIAKIQKDLPKHWIVRFSTKYKDRVFYYNHATKEATWTFPEKGKGLCHKSHSSKTREPHVNFKIKSNSSISDKNALKKSYKVEKESGDDITNKLKRSSAKLNNKTSSVVADTFQPKVKRKRKLHEEYQENAGDRDKKSSIKPCMISPLKRNDATKQPVESVGKSLLKKTAASSNSAKQSDDQSRLYRNPLLSSARPPTHEHSLPLSASSSIDSSQNWNVKSHAKVIPVRKSASKTDIEMLDVSLSEDASVALRTCGPAVIYIVVDTNIFLLADGLRDIDAIIDWYPLPGVHFRRAVLVVPWVVLQELDHLKTNKQTTVKARRAVTFLNRHFCSKKPGIRGQTILEAATVIKGLNTEMNDDRILQCCFFFSHLPGNHKTILFSKDRNLCNKAMINHFRTFSSISSIVKELTDMCKSDCPVYDEKQTAMIHCPSEETFDKKEKYDVNLSGCDETDDDLFDSLQEFARPALACILETEMKKAYGEDLWQEIIIRKPPWSLLDILHCIKKHWIAVFSMTGADRLLTVHVDKLMECLKCQTIHSSPSKTPKSGNSSYPVKEFLSSSIQLIAGIGKDYMQISCVNSSFKKLQKHLNSQNQRTTSSQDSNDASRRDGNNDSLLDEIDVEIETSSGDSIEATSPEYCAIFWQVLDKIWESIITHSVAIFKSLNFTYPPAFSVAPVELQQQLAEESTQAIPSPEMCVHVIPLLMKLIEGLLNALERFLFSCNNQCSPTLAECLDLLQTLWTITQAFSVETNLERIRPITVQHCCRSSEEQSKLFIGYQKLHAVCGVLKECSSFVLASMT